MGAHVDIKIGAKYNRLTVIKELDRVRGMRKFECRCECGTVTVKWFSGLRSGSVKSCGCYLRDRAKITGLHRRKPTNVVHLNELLKRYVHSATKRNLKFDLTFDQFHSLVEQPCAFCRRPPHNLVKRRHYDDYAYTGIDRLNPQKGYVFGNCVPCCKTCNYAKQTMTLDQFLDWIKLVYLNTYNMNTHDYKTMTDKLTGVPAPGVLPTKDHSTETTVALDILKRMGNQPKPEEKPIPALGVMPVPN